MVFPADENGNNPMFRLKGMQIIHKQTDGAWKISRYMWNDYPLE